MSFFVLCINPGSTSTKTAVFEENLLLYEETLRHSTDDLSRFMRISDQYSFRKQVIINFLLKCGFDTTKLSAVVGTGGLLKPIRGGTYLVNEAIIKELKCTSRGEHASNLGGLLAYEFACDLGILAFIVDPVVVDEMEKVAKISGHPSIERKSVFHALNQKAVAKRYAHSKGVEYNSLNLIVAHLGGGISVGAHHKGRVVDVNNALDGEGPLSPERSGGLPAGDLVTLCFSGFSLSEIKKMITGKGGLVAYLGTNDGKEVLKRIEAGDDYAELVYRALAYQIAKEIGAMAAVLKGEVDAIILTGGLACDQACLTPWIIRSVSFIAKVVVMPAENEMLALCEGALRVLHGFEAAQIYE